MLTGISLWGDSIGRGVVYDEQRGRYAIYRDNLFGLLRRRLDIPVDSYAFMGSTAAEGALRMDNTQLKPGSLAIIEYGGNDCDMPWADISANPQGEYRPRATICEFRRALSAMVARARAQGACPVLVTPPPLDAQRYFDWVSRRLSHERILEYLGDVQYIYRWQERYAGAVRALAAELGCALYDLRDQFLGARNLKAMLCVDGIHPNPKGYEFISNYATKRLNEVYDVVI